ncbi:MAG TPA: DUF4236 domain-containing protein [Sphingomicrobium sp.]|nr:DUF4236 domain-containing protein [Sphingomicrobium sp.]
MGLRFRQTFKLFPGVHLNLSKTGISASFGAPGATLNIGPRSLSSTVGLPGTGLSYRTQHSLGHRQTNVEPAIPDCDPLPPAPLEPTFPQPVPATYWQAKMREIGSASVEQLTSESLRELREMVAEARSQREEISSDLNQAQLLLKNQTVDLERRKRSIFRYFYKNRIADLESALPGTNVEVERLKQWLEATHVEIKFETNDAAKKAYAALVRTFDVLRTTSSVWDITSDRNTDRVIERTSAARMLTRDLVQVDFSTSNLVKFEGRPMRFQNVNGEDLLIYPGVAIMPRADGAFALIDLRDLSLEYNAVRFIEEDAIPPDAHVVDQTWAKTNKDGSPDRRFSNNYAIPVCLYGRLVFTSSAGIEEEYQFSNAAAAGNFARAFGAYQQSLSTD